jgi:hypothetical protein
MVKPNGNIPQNGLILLLSEISCAARSDRSSVSAPSSKTDFKCLLSDIKHNPFTIILEEVE